MHTGIKGVQEMKKDLTNSQLDRQNILNNNMALEEIRNTSNIQGVWFEDKVYFTKNMVAEFFEVDIRTIERCVSANLPELEKNGYEIIKGTRLKGFIEAASLFNAAGIDIGIIASNVVLLLIIPMSIDLVNKKTGGATKYINQRDKDFLHSYLQEDDYRREFTDALRDFVDMNQFKYAIFTDMIYQSIFKENAKEYREVLNLKKSDRTRDTFYSEILDLIASYECGLAEMIRKKAELEGRKITNWEVREVFKEFEELPHWKPLINGARTKMASRDLALRDSFHQQLESYIKPLDQSEYDKFLGAESDQVARLMDENRDVLKRLKERE